MPVSGPVAGALAFALGMSLGANAILVLRRRPTESGRSGEAVTAPQAVSNDAALVTTPAPASGATVDG